MGISEVHSVLLPSHRKLTCQGGVLMINSIIMNIKIKK